MSESIGFEEKITGLADYWRSLHEIDPCESGQRSAPREEIFYASGALAVSRALAGARKSVLLNIGCHAREEYKKRGYIQKELAEDTYVERLERADILSVMTAPLTTEIREARAERIKSLLDRVTTGDIIDIAEFSVGPHHHGSQSTAVDTSRKLFTVFSDDTKCRTMYIQYDRADYYGRMGSIENALSVCLSAMFKGDGILPTHVYAA